MPTHLAHAEREQLRAKLLIAALDHGRRCYAFLETQEGFQPGGADWSYPDHLAATSADELLALVLLALDADDLEGAK